MSVSASTHEAPQQVCPAAHTSAAPHLHAPEKHAFPRGAHAIPQPPQLFWSLLTVEQTLPQHSCPAEHIVTSVHARTQRASRHVVPSGHGGVQPPGPPSRVPASERPPSIPRTPASNVPPPPPPDAHAKTKPPLASVINTAPRARAAPAHKRLLPIA